MHIIDPKIVISFNIGSVLSIFYCFPRNVFAMSILGYDCHGCDFKMAKNLLKSVKSGYFEKKVTLVAIFKKF